MRRVAPIARRRCVILRRALRRVAAWPAAAVGPVAAPTPRPRRRAALRPAGARSSSRAARPATATTPRGKPDRAPDAARRGRAGGRLLPAHRPHAAGQPDRRAARARSPPTPRSRHRRAGRLRRLARRARASRRSTRRAGTSRGRWRCSPRTAPAATRSSARGGHRHRRARAGARRRDADADRRGGPRRALPDAAVRRQQLIDQATAGLDRPLRPVDARTPTTAGGWGIGHIGPIPEGMVAWFLAMAVAAARRPPDRGAGSMTDAPPAVAERRTRATARGARRRGRSWSSRTLAARPRSSSYVVADRHDRSCSAHRLGWRSACLAVPPPCSPPGCASTRRRRSPSRSAAASRHVAEARGRARRWPSDLRRAADGITRRRAARRRRRGRRRRRSAGALVVPADRRSAPSSSATRRTRPPWRRRARGWSTTDGEALRADASRSASFASAFPEGADKRELGSPVVVVRLDPGDAEAAARAAAAGRRAGSWPSRRSAPTPAARSRSSATRSYEQRPRPGARLPVPLLDLRRAPGRQGRLRPRRRARCRSCRSPSTPDGNLVAAGPLSGRSGPRGGAVRKT